MEKHLFLALWGIGLLVPQTGFAEKVITVDDVTPVVATVKGNTYSVVAKVEGDKYAQVWITPGGRPYVEVAKGTVRYVENAKTKAAYELFYVADNKGNVEPLPEGHETEKDAEVETVRLAGNNRTDKADTVLLKGSNRDATQILEVCFPRAQARRQARRSYYYSGSFQQSQYVQTWGYQVRPVNEPTVQPANPPMSIPTPMPSNVPTISGGVRREPSSQPLSTAVAYYRPSTGGVVYVVNCP